MARDRNERTAARKPQSTGTRTGGPHPGRRARRQPNDPGKTCGQAAGERDAVEEDVALRRGSR